MFDAQRIIEQHPLLAVISLAVVVYSLFSAIRAFLPSNRSSLPCIGVTRRQPFASIASWQSVAKSHVWLQEAYEKYSQKGQAYTFPDISGRHEVVIPNDQLKWLVDKPDNEASVLAAHFDTLHGEYAFTDSYLLKTGFHEHVVHKSLARNIDSVIPRLQDEIKAAFDDQWGTDTRSAKSVVVSEDVMSIVARASNCMFVGQPLCRNEEFLKNNSRYAMGVVTTVALLPLFPSIFHPILGPLMSLPTHYYASQIKKCILPHIKQRIADMELKDKDPSTKIEIPEDYITWHIRIAKVEGKTKELEPAMISKFLLVIEFAAIHTTALTATMLLFDLFSSDPSKGFVEGIREEAERLYAECGGQWDKKTLSKMLRADSAIRESMRHSTFMTKGLQRKILNKDGLHSEEGGWTVPYGSYACVDVNSRQHDPEIYPQPNTYDAFRFSRPREEYEATHTDRTSNEEYVKMKNLSMISTGENFMVFGHGRHACPGRFFVQHEIKIMLAYIVMNYDVEMLPERPANMVFGTNIIPPAKAQLRFVRRPGTV